MLDDNRDKDMMRNQLIAIIIMTVATVIWFNYFMPAPPPVQPGAPAPQQVTQEQPVQPAAPAPAPPSAAVWEDVPAVTAAELEDVQDVVIENGRLRLTFTRVGARLKAAHVLLGEKEALSEQLVPVAPDVPDAEAIYPLSLEFSNEEYGREFNRRLFDAQIDPDGLGATFSFTLPDRLALRKTVRLEEDSHVLDVDVEVENLRPADIVLGLDTIPAYKLIWEPNLAASDATFAGVSKYLVWRSGGETRSTVTTSISSDTTDGTFTVREPDWAGLKSMYFLTAMRPEYEGGVVRAYNDGEYINVGLTVPRLGIPEGGVQRHRFQVYLGPLQLDSLRSAWPNLTTSLRFFESVDIMDWFAKLLLSLLHWFYEHTIPNYGVAIILLTIVVRTLLFPLTLKSMRSMKRMQQLAPELERIKEECGDNQQEYQKRIMEMYRERGINPLGGCLPMLLQMPIFFALYRMLWHAFEMRGAPFFGHIQDLSKPDQLITFDFMRNVPLIGEYFYSLNILPILMALAMVLNTKLLPPSGPMQNPQQKFIMNFMPVLFSVICYNMASGLNLYILTSTILGMVQQAFIRTGDVSLEKPKKPKTVGKRQHWYTAAKARQRQAAREAKRTKPARGKNPSGKTSGK